MKKYLLLIALFFGVAPFAFAADEAPAKDVREFYDWYVRTAVQTEDILGTRRQELKKFVTGRLLREIDGMKKGESLSADYFLAAQDIDPDWAKNVTIESSNISEGRGTMDVTLTGAKMNTKLRVSVVKKKQRWKVDRVESRS